MWDGDEPIFQECCLHGHVPGTSDNTTRTICPSSMRHASNGAGLTQFAHWVYIYMAYIICDHAYVGTTRARRTAPC